MKVSLNWLSDYIDLHTDPTELAAILTRAGLEVEEISTSGTIPDGVVAARILSRDKHPNSDHLSICQVEYGAEAPIQIVCGAPNCDAGKTVPLATLGTVFTEPDGKKFEMKKCKLRGVDSYGMMCSARELGIGSEHDGLMILPEDTELGTPLKDLFKGDTVYTLEVTPNRPDWLSHWGVARDISALCGGILKFPDVSVPEVAPSSEWDRFITVEAADLCPKYTARVIRGVKVGPSPEWLVKRLESVGIRSIDNIVDITNFVMMELGVPLHAFDRRFLTGGRIVVRRAKDGEKILALDGKEYELNSDNLVICDTEKPSAIAGVMGGEHSGVLPDTTEIVLESAWFHPSSVRMTSRKLGLSSDASYRFERGADLGMVERASARAAHLILQLAGGELVSPLLKNAQPDPEPVWINCRYDRIRSLLGITVSNLEMATIFSKLGMDVEPVNDATARVIPPTYRADVKMEADLAEEVARVYGLDKLPNVPVKAVKVFHIDRDVCMPVSRLRDALVSAGLYEFVNMSMLDRKSALADGHFTDGELVVLKNPISQELAVMRPSVLPGMLASVRHNIARRNLNIAAFEIGNCFCKSPERYPEERMECAIALTGQRHPERFSSERTELYDFFDLKGLVETFFENIGIKHYSFEADEDSALVKGQTASVKVNGKKLGVLGLAKPELSKGMRLQTPLYLAILQFDQLIALNRKVAEYKPLSQFPATTRDVAFLAPLDMENSKVIEFIQRAKVKNLISAQLVDIFTNDAIGKEKKSMAYSLTFRSDEKTLTDDEVNQANDKLRAKLAGGLGVELR